MKIIDVLDELRDQKDCAITRETIHDHIFSFGNPADAILYYNLFCPKLISLEGIVTFESWKDDEAAFARLTEQTALYAKGLISAEILQHFLSGYNYLELSYLFDRCNGSISHEYEHFLGTCLVEAWASWFPSKFPKETFDFFIIPSKPDEADDIEVSFVQHIA